MRGLIAKILGDVNKKEIKKISGRLPEINDLEEEMKALSDADLQAKTSVFRSRLDETLAPYREKVQSLLEQHLATPGNKDIERDYEDAKKELQSAKQNALNSILPEAFAVVREASWRVLKMRHFDVQLLGGIVLHQGRIAEMKTGEGKTLVATLPAYLNALSGDGVHIVTVNDYLASRDSKWMGEVYEFLGLSVGLIVHGKDPAQRREAYYSDITYGTNNEFGFDYLRDNMVVYKENLVQRPLNYAIIDEVDSILVDEARTPLIISGQMTDDKQQEDYLRYDMVVRGLQREKHYTVDEKAHTVELTEDGEKSVESRLGIHDLYGEEDVIYEDKELEEADTKAEENYRIIRKKIDNALKSYGLMHRDKDYVVKDGEVVIVDEFTGRLMFGRRYSDGLHQAIEAKEKVKVAKESMTLASITFQNYFRMFEKLAGMTGTAVTEEEEFQSIYGLDVVVIPTNKPMIRNDLPDVVYKSERGKFRAVVEEIAQRHATGQPLLVGTISIEKSEELSRMLQKKGVRHEVLNAKQHEREAEIVSLAGQCNSVTIATNMAGRGTDIVLGEGVPALGGLHIIGTERHEARRIDNQLRGRAGRQGDPGSTQFYISLDDDLMRLFGGDNITGIMEKLGMEEDMPIDHPLISRAIETAQKRVEGRNFDIRKHILEYDDVINQQRKVIYSQRRRVLEGENLNDTVLEWLPEIVEDALSLYVSDKVFDDEWDIKSLLDYAEGIFLKPRHFSPKELQGKNREDLYEMFLEAAMQHYAEREEKIGPETMRELERVIILRSVDSKWMTHIDAMDDLRQGVGLRAYGQRDPLVEYKSEAFEMFQEMIHSLKEESIRLLYRVQVAAPPQRKAVAVANETPPSDGTAVHGVVRSEKIGRNDPCPCGSGKKHKKCCGK